MWFRLHPKSIVASGASSYRVAVIRLPPDEPSGTTEYTSIQRDSSELSRFRQTSEASLSQILFSDRTGFGFTKAREHLRARPGDVFRQLLLGRVSIRLSFCHSTEPTLPKST